MSFIYKAIGAVLSFFDSIFGSYLLAIMIFALIVKLLMLPLGIKQQKNMQKQATLRPKEMAIKKKYKGREQDREAMMQMQQEIQEMYRANNFNQFGGCLPLLIQLPIILIIYKAITSPLSYICNLSAETIKAICTHIGANNGFFGVAESALKNGVYTPRNELELTNLLSKSDFFENIAANVEGLTDIVLPNFSLGSVNLGEVPSFASWLVLIPILTFIVQFGSMRLTRMFSYQPEMPNQGCSNWVMDITMPLMTTVMAFQFPALLGIYWVFQSILGVVQQFVLKKIYPMPQFTEEDYKAAERAMRGKGGNRTIDTGKKYRSLHNIDADDE